MPRFKDFLLRFDDTEFQITTTAALAHLGATEEVIQEEILEVLLDMLLSDNKKVRIASALAIQNTLEREDDEVDARVDFALDCGAVSTLNEWSKLFYSESEAAGCQITVIIAHILRTITGSNIGSCHPIYRSVDTNDINNINMSNDESNISITSESGDKDKDQDKCEGMKKYTPTPRPREKDIMDIIKSKDIQDTQCNKSKSDSMVPLLPLILKILRIEASPGFPSPSPSPSSSSFSASHIGPGCSNGSKNSNGSRDSKDTALSRESTYLSLLALRNIFQRTLETVFVALDSGVVNSLFGILRDNTIYAQVDSLLAARLCLSYTVQVIGVISCTLDYADMFDPNELEKFLYKHAGDTITNINTGNCNGSDTPTTGTRTKTKTRTRTRWKTAKDWMLMIFNKDNLGTLVHMLKDDRCTPVWDDVFKVLLTCLESRHR